MPQLELYENKEILDTELPAQISNNLRQKETWVFASHWHEHLELHYIVKGEATFYLNQQSYEAGPGDFVIINSNELHTAYCKKVPYSAYVVIFDIGDISPELAKKNCLFRSLVRSDRMVEELMGRIHEERHRAEFAYKQICRGLILELLAYMCRNFVVQMIPERDVKRRKKDLDRLNTVLNCISPRPSPTPSWQRSPASARTGFVMCSAAVWESLRCSISMICG